MYDFLFDILNIILNDNNSVINNIILFYNKYKFIDYYYYIYINFYPIYKFFKKFMILLYFNILKLYIIFINDTIFFNLNNILLILLFKLKKWMIYNLKFYNKSYFKLRKKYKYYYRFGKIGYLKIIFFLTIFLLLILMWKNRTAYYKIYFILYPVLFYVLTINLCVIIVPFFYYKFIGILFVIFFVFIIFLLKILN
jgi:hypothetical protein